MYAVLIQQGAESMKRARRENRLEGNLTEVVPPEPGVPRACTSHLCKLFVFCRFPILESDS